MSKLIAVVGGTGAGKSTVCTRLMDEHPDTIGMVQLDDYFKPGKDVPVVSGYQCWDHPDSLYIDKLVSDLTCLKRGESVVINTKNERLNPEYVRTDKRVPVRFDPKPVMLVEGFLVLWDERVRVLLDDSIFLDVAHDIRYSRRVHFKDNGYEKNVLLPLQKQYLEPTKEFAKHVIDVSALNTDEVFGLVDAVVRPYLTI